MKTPFFRRLFIIFAFIFAASVIFTEFYITRIVRQNFLENIRKDLTVQATLIADSIDFTGPITKNALDKLKKMTGARITLIATDGKVMGDSEKDPATMENHKSRPEIQQAAVTPRMPIRIANLSVRP